MSTENDAVARLANTWRFPTEIRFGVGRIDQAAAHHPVPDFYCQVCSKQ